MIHPNAHLVDDLFNEEKLEDEPTRDGFGHGVVEIGREDERIVVVCADLADSTRASWFQEAFPERYIEVGVAEQNLATVASGLANYGKIPFITSYAAFSPGRNFEQIRTTIALNDVPVIVCGMHAGISVGPDGATHQPLEDIGLMRMLPNMTVLVPADAEEARKATIAAAKLKKPVYIRLGRAAAPVFTTAETPFQIGVANVLWESKSERDPEVVIIACGALVYEALAAARDLDEEGTPSIVINNASVKPMDEKTILAAVARAKAVVVAEEHQQAGGMGSAVAELSAKKCPVPIEFVGIDDSFGQSGEPDELLDHYGLRGRDIKLAVDRVLKRRT